MSRKIHDISPLHQIKFFHCCNSRGWGAQLLTSPQLLPFATVVDCYSVMVAIVAVAVAIAILIQTGSL